MKKILIFLFVLLLIGCGEVSSPKNEVLKLFLNYNSLSSDLLIQLDSVVNKEDLTDEEKEKFKDILKKQYEDLKYKIVDEVISGDNSVVSVEIEVYDLAKALRESDEYLNNNKELFYIDNKFSNELFWDYKLEKMSEEKDRIRYNLDLTLTKIDKKWVLDELLESNRIKIHGLYNE